MSPLWGRLPSINRRRRVGERLREIQQNLVVPTVQVRLGEPKSLLVVLQAGFKQSSSPFLLDLSSDVTYARCSADVHSPDT